MSLLPGHRRSPEYACLQAGVDEECLQEILYPCRQIFGGLADAQEITDELLDEWWTYFYQCSECRRCSVFCPYGIDTAEITMAAREIMDGIGLGSKYNLEIVNKAETLGNNLGMTPPALINTHGSLLKKR